MSKYVIGKDNNSIPVYSLNFIDGDHPDLITQGAEVILTPSLDTTFTIGVNIKRLWISYSTGATVYVAKQTSALAVPSSASFVASATEVNPTVRDVKEGDEIHFISEDVATVTLRFDEVDR